MSGAARLRAEPAETAPPRAGFSRRWLITWLAGVAVTGVAFLAAGAVLVANQPHHFVVEAHTEFLWVPSAEVRHNDAWSVRGAQICAERFSARQGGFERDCQSPRSDDVEVVIPSGSSLVFLRGDRRVLSPQDAPEHNASDAVPEYASADASGDGPGLAGDEELPETTSGNDAASARDNPRLASLKVAIEPAAGKSVLVRAREAPGESHSGTLILSWSEPPGSPLYFRGLAEVGQLPEHGNRGVLIKGRASAHMAARAGASRFEIAAAELVAGDVVRVAMPQSIPWQSRLHCELREWLRAGPTRDCLLPKEADMWGFVRYDTEMPAGFSVVYSGPAESVIVNRLGARFEMRPGWTDRLQLDPLAQLLYSGATLAAALLTVLLGLKAGKIIYWEIVLSRDEIDAALAEEIVAAPDAPNLPAKPRSGSAAAGIREPLAEPDSSIETENTATPAGEEQR